LLGDVSSSAATHFDLLPAAVAALLVGGGIWAYHAHVLGEREGRPRGEVDRVYDYLLSAAGLIVAASGLTTLIAVALVGISGAGSTATDSGDAIATALTLLLIGVPLWWWYWSTIQRHRRTDPSGELHSIPRRIYILGLFGVAAIVGVVSLIVIVFIVVEDALDGTFGADTLESAAIAIALLTTAGALAWYHLAVFREDREEELPDEPTEDKPAGDSIVPAGLLEAAIDALVAGGQTSVTVTRVDDGYKLTASN
jgi:hypothetical protein